MYSGCYLPETDKQETWLPETLDPAGQKNTLYLVFAISTGMEASVVTRPLIILAQKWHRMLSEKASVGTTKYSHMLHTY